jgi:hypothetical protein
MDLFVEIKTWIESNSTFVQGISAFASVIIIFFTLIFTIIYVRATFRLVHIPYKSFIKPVGINTGNNSNFFLKIHNFGPGLAVDVKIIGFINKSINRESNPRDGFTYKQIYIASGNSEIESNKDTAYLFPFFLCFNEPFIVKWRSITGKSYRTVWLRKESWSEMFEQQKIIGKIRCLFRFILYYLRLPLVLLKKKRYFEYAYVKIKILKVLQTEISLSYDHIADNSRRNDEEIKLILSRMKKQGLVEFDGDTATITEKGKMCIDDRAKG